MNSVFTRANLLIIVLLGLFFSGYSWGAQTPFSLSVKSDVSAKAVQKAGINGVMKTRLMQQFRTWEGVRYRLGGTGRHGIDCSAFVREVMQALNIRLPRTTEHQIARGIPVARQSLKAGDLVFFKPTQGTRHVGIYLGKGQFMHSSTSKGVTISSLDNIYWTTRYHTAKRLVTDGFDA